MLVQYTPISSLSQEARLRLLAVASSLMMTNEASRGHVMFEGKYFSTRELQQFASQSRQFLAEG